MIKPYDDWKGAQLRMSDPVAWNEDEESLAAVYQTWETEDLVRAVSVETSSYMPEALHLLRQELERRNVTTAEQLDLAETAEAQRQENLVGVKGWLRFFVVVLTLNSLVLIFVSPSPWIPGLSLSVRLLFAAPLLGLLGLVTSVLLVKSHPRAPNWAMAWLILNIFIGMGSKFFANGSTSLLSTLAGGILWLRYFSVSKRVKATYVEGPDERDLDLSFPQDSAQKNNPYAPPGSRRVE
jgi:hypothetical protein